MKIKPLPFLLALFVVLSASAQDKRVDSLKLRLNDPKVHDTTKLQSILLVMGRDYNTLHPTYQYLNRIMGDLALKNYNKKHDPKSHKVYAQYLGTYYNALMIEYGEKREVKKALAYIDKSIAIFKAEKLYDDMYYSVVAKGTFLSKINQYDKAIAYLFEALKYFEKNPKANADGIAYVQSSIAAIYSDRGMEEKAIEYNKKVASYYDTKKPLYAEDEYSKSVCYANMGTSYSVLKKYPEAMSSFNNALQLSQKIGDAAITSVVLTKMATIKMDQGKIDEAETLIKQSLNGAIDEMSTANAFVKLGEMYYKKNNFKNAEDYLTKALAISKKIKNLALQEQASYFLFEASKKNKNFEKALETHLLHDKLTDSTQMEASRNSLEKQQLKYDFEKRELEYKLIAEREKTTKNNWLIGLSVTVLLLLSGGWAYYRNNRQKQAIHLLEKNLNRQKLLVSQMNPHFIFNSVDNIQGLIQNNHLDKAIDYLTQFSSLTRQILENSSENYISLTEELEMIRNYVNIQQLLFNNTFDYTIDIDQTIDSDSVFLPPMLAQPFIENAIKHGKSVTETQKISIRFYFIAEKLFFEVTDNGEGFRQDKKQGRHKSLAMSITKERLIHYSKKGDIVITTENIIDQYENVAGAKVVFEIPYIYEN